MFINLIAAGQNLNLKVKGKVCIRASEVAGSSAQSFSWFQFSEVTSSISTPSGWDACPLQGYPLA